MNRIFPLLIRRRLYHSDPGYNFVKIVLATCVLCSGVFGAVPCASASGGPITPSAVITDVASFGSNMAWPCSGLTVYDGSLFGTASDGPDRGGGFYSSTIGAGAVFKVVGNSVVPVAVFNGNDGLEPTGGLTVFNNRLYGTTTSGGPKNTGCIYEVTGNSVSAVAPFSGGGSGIDQFLTPLGGNLYGYEWQEENSGGANQAISSVFVLSGSSLNDISQFDTTSYNGIGGNGMEPAGSLTVFGGHLYGVATGGGQTGNGVVFEVANPFGGKIDHVLHRNIGILDIASFDGQNGQFPETSLVPFNGALYGATSFGGGTGHGDVYEVSGNNIVDVADFTGSDSGGARAQVGSINPLDPYANVDFYGNFTAPGASLVVFDGNLYGTTPFGGANGRGEVFEVAGNTVKDIADFNGENGAIPISLTVFNNALYGTTTQGGASGNGTVFTVSFRGVGLNANSKVYGL